MVYFLFITAFYSFSVRVCKILRITVSTNYSKNLNLKVVTSDIDYRIFKCFLLLLFLFLLQDDKFFQERNLKWEKEKFYSYFQMTNLTSWF